MALVVGLAAAACSGADHSAGTATANRGPQISISSFTSDLSVMREFKTLAAVGKGKVAAILPDTISSARYAEFDAPDIKKALTIAGLRASDIIVQNASGNDATQMADAKSDITHGATILLLDPLDSNAGTAIERYAASRGVDVIDYDRLTLGGSREYYVTFDGVAVGTLLGKGLASCVAAWHVTSPQIVVMHGPVTDNNATLFAQGYESVIAPYVASGGWSDVATTAGTWNPSTAAAEFESAYTAYPRINAVLAVSDQTAASIVAYLKTLHVPPRTFPITGQDSTLLGLQNVLSGYQCGSVYKPIYVEAGAAAALALYLRADKKPPSSLVNVATTDTTSNISVPSILITPEWVTTSNMNATVVKNGVIPVAELCAEPYTAGCAAAGITP